MAPAWMPHRLQDCPAVTAVVAAAPVILQTVQQRHVLVLQPLLLGWVQLPSACLLLLLLLLLLL
jgi:hypothetical protein